MQVIQDGSWTWHPLQILGRVLTNGYNARHHLWVGRGKGGVTSPGAGTQHRKTARRSLLQSAAPLAFPNWCCGLWQSPVRRCPSRDAVGLMCVRRRDRKSIGLPSHGISFVDKAIMFFSGEYRIGEAEVQQTSEQHR